MRASRLRTGILFVAGGGVGELELGLYTGLKRPMGFLVLQAFGLRLGFEA